MPKVVTSPFLVFVDSIGRWACFVLNRADPYQAEAFYWEAIPEADAPDGQPAPPTPTPGDKCIVRDRYVLEGMLRMRGFWSEEGRLLGLGWSLAGRAIKAATGAHPDRVADTPDVSAKLIYRKSDPGGRADSDWGGDVAWPPRPRLP